MQRGRRRITVAAPSVVAPDAPTLTAPADESDVYPGVAVTVSATVTAGQVPDRVDFVLDPGGGEEVIATDSASPFSQSWTPTEAQLGAHTLVARFVYGSGSVDSTAIDVAVFDPTELAGKAGLWLPENTVRTGALVDTWSDTGGAARDWLGGVQQPSYEATGGPNGTPNVNFPDTKFLYIPSDPFGALTAADIFAVLRVDSVAASRAVWGLGASYLGNGDEYYPYSANAHILEDAGSTTRQDCGDPSQDLTAWHVLRVTSTATEYSVTVGDEALFTTGTNAVNFAVAPALGAHVQAAPTRFMVGDFAFLMILDHKASAGDVTRLKGWLAARFGAIPGTS